MNISSQQATTPDAKAATIKDKQELMQCALYCTTEIGKPGGPHVSHNPLR